MDTSLFKSALHDVEVKEKVYRGARIAVPDSVRGKCVVTVDDAPLSSILQAEYFPKDYPLFEWGSRWGMPCKNLAASILLDMFDESYVTFYVLYKFREDVISRLSFDGWYLGGSTLEAWMDVQEREMEKHGNRSS